MWLHTNWITSLVYFIIFQFIHLSLVHKLKHYYVHKVGIYQLIYYLVSLNSVKWKAEIADGLEESSLLFQLYPGLSVETDKKYQHNQFLVLNLKPESLETTTQIKYLS